jgi:hypothetical protein
MSIRRSCTCSWFLFSAWRELPLGKLRLLIQLEIFAGRQLLWWLLARSPRWSGRQVDVLQQYARSFHACSVSGRAGSKILQVPRVTRSPRSDRWYPYFCVGGSLHQLGTVLHYPALPLVDSLDFAVLPQRALLGCWTSATTVLAECEEQDAVGRVTGCYFGVEPDSEYPVCSVPLEPSDRFLLCTDGVTETENAPGEAFGDLQLERVVRNNRSEPRLGELTRYPSQMLAPRNLAVAKYAISPAPRISGKSQ